MGLKVIDYPLISHQPEDEKYKCLRPIVFGRQVLVCSRCFGIYSAFAIALAAIFLSNFEILFLEELLLLFILTSAAFANWIYTKLSKNKSSNLMRVISGSCLGVAMAIIASHILRFEITLVYFIVPAFFAVVFLIVEKLKKAKCD